MAGYSIDGNVTDQNDAPVAGALVYVYDYTGTLAPLTDSLGQDLANPVTSGEDGYWSAFVAASGFYTLKYWWGDRLRSIEAGRPIGEEALAGGVILDARDRSEAAATSATDAAAAALTAKTGSETARDDAVVARDEAEGFRDDASAQFADAATALAAGTVSDLVGTRIYASKSALDADLVPADGLYALVIGDATAANNDLYKKNGATTTGSWTGPLGLFAAASAAATAAAATAVLNAAALQKTGRYGVAAPLASGVSNAGSYAIVRVDKTGRVKTFYYSSASAGTTTLWRATKTGDQADPTAGTFTQVGTDVAVTLASGADLSVAVDFAVNAGEWLMIDTARVSRPAVTGAKQYRLGAAGTRSGAAVAANNVQFQAAFGIDYLYLTTTEHDTTKAAVRSVVAHKNDATVARPSGFGSVEWRGYVKPTNAIKGDTVVLLPLPADFAGSSKAIPYIADRWCQIYAGDIEPFQVRSGLVEDVFDRSGCDNHLNAVAQIRKPAYLAVDSNFNGKPSLVFSGTNGLNNGGGSGTSGIGEPKTLLDRMNRPARVIRQGATFFMVVRLTDLTGLAAATLPIVDSFSSVATERLVVGLRNGEWAYYAGRGPVGGETYVKSGVAIDTNPHLITVVFNGVNSFMKIGSTTVVAVDPGPATMASLTLMRSTDTVPGALAYFDAIEHACTATEIAAMEAWASATFGAGVLT